MENKSIFRWLSFILSIPLLILLVSSPISAQIVYPCEQDALYPCKEVTPSYIEASDPPDGNILTIPEPGDDVSLQVNLPFPFTFYGVPYTTAWANTNGYLNFLHDYTYFTNYSIPRLTLPNGTIYVFWDDLVADPSNASIRTQLLGIAPKRQFVIEWRNVTLNNDWVNRFDFEIVLHETGAILLQYRNIDIGTGETGSSATIGLENQTGDAAAVVSFNRPSIESPQFAMLFGKVEKNVPVDIKPRRCPNAVNLVSKGVLRVAILGTADVPVSDIDPTSVTLQGIAPRRWHVEDVGTPYEPFVGKGNIYNCNNLGPDGYPDLVFTFDTDDVVGTSGTLGTLKAGQPLLLKLDGKLLDGTGIKGEDSIVIIRAHHKWEKERRGHHPKKEKEKDHHKKGKDKDHHDSHHDKRHDKDDDDRDDDDD